MNKLNAEEGIIFNTLTWEVTQRESEKMAA